MQFSLKRVIKVLSYGSLLVAGFLATLVGSRFGGHEVSDGLIAPIAYADVPYSGDSVGDAGDGSSGGAADGDGCGGSDGDDGGE
jgi:hypothetical protein